MMYGYSVEQLTSFFRLRGKHGRNPEVRGEELVCCCPFPHYKPERGTYFEQNPSFAVNLRNGYYNCYSCGKKGRGIDDLAWELGLSSPNITRDHYLMEESSKEKPVIPQRYKQYLAYNKDRADEYFSRRGISPQTTEKFGIGGTRDGSKVFIPLCNREGILEGWQERHLDSKDSRWVTEPYGFVRSEFIFGLQFAKEKGTILLESTTDALRLDSLGYSVVATLGAEISNRQFEILSDNFVELTAVPQNDPAGKRWADSVRRKLKGKLDLYIWNLPEIWKDPGAAPDYALGEILAKRKFVK